MTTALRTLALGIVLSAGLGAGMAPTSAAAAAPGLYQPRGAEPQQLPRSASKRRAVRPRAATIENGRVCTTIDFEGVGDLTAVPTIAGIHTPEWLGIVDYDVGGSGNFAQEPSPQTIAFWLGGNPAQRDIVFDNPASKVEFFYASFVGVQVTAYDASGAVLDSTFGFPNWNQGVGDPTGDFNRWDPLKVEAPGNKIKTVRVTGNTDQTGIDNLKVCTSITVDAVELTQAIQEYQSLDDLKASLAATREPPVPLVAGKPAAVRVYFQKVDNVTTVRVRLSGAINETRALALQPQCSAEDQRRQRNGCQSIDFYFTPPEGNWDLKLEVLDPSDEVLDTHDLPLKSRKTDTLALRAVSVCDAKDAAGNWLCEPAAGLAGAVGALRKIAPTASVTVATTNSVVRRDVAVYASVDNWWPVAIKDVNDLYGLFDSAVDLFGSHRVYYGMIRPALPGGTGGMAHDLPSRGAGSRSSVTRLGVETVAEVVAHETGHTLGLRHTNNGLPAAGASPPGCYNLAVDGATDWAFADNRIQSAARLEVGFDVATKKALAPESTFEIMSYCVPRWISPQRYRSMITALDGGAAARIARPVRKPKARRMGPAVAAAGGFWTVSGSIDGSSGAVSFDPLFDDAAQGPADSGSGSHRLEVRDAADNVLALRRFTPTSASSETDGPEIHGPASFFEILPTSPTATRIVMIAPGEQLVGQITFGGAAPTVSLLSPAGGSVSGPQLVQWNVADTDSAEHASRVYYSPDNGATWSQIGRLDSGNSLLVDFATLPGADGTARVMVSASDGVNSASASSLPFSVPRSAPSTVRILSPQPGTALLPLEPVTLEGMAYDVDDGLLDGASVVWRSDRAGLLGTGAVLRTDKLGKGTHRLTMTATDRDGQSAAALLTVKVAGGAPTMDLTTTGLDQYPTTCVEATIDPRIEPGSVGLQRVEYSLDGGLAWTTVPLNRVPFKLIVPGSGYVHLVARAYDQAGQSAAADARFIVDSPCVQAGAPKIAGTVFAQDVVAPGVQYVDITFTNGGRGEAQQIAIESLALRTLSGSGQVSIDATRTPPLPIALPNLLVGQTTTLRIHLNVPASVKRFSITESGRLRDRFGRPLSFSTAQSVIPR